MVPLKFSALAAALVVGTAPVGHAATATFEFLDLGINGYVSPAGTTRVVSAAGAPGAPTLAVTTTDPSGGADTLAQYDALGFGNGVKGTTGEVERDRLGLGETMRFDFGVPVAFVGVETIDFYSGIQTFNLASDGVSIGQGWTSGGDGYMTQAGNGAPPFDTVVHGQSDINASAGAGGSFTGTVFDITMTTDNPGEPDGLWIASFTIEYEPAVVPLPATAPLLAGALLLGGWAIRRRKARA